MQQVENRGFHPNTQQTVSGNSFNITVHKQSFVYKELTSFRKFWKFRFLKDAQEM